MEGGLGEVDSFVDTKALSCPQPKRSPFSSVSGGTRPAASRAGVRVPRLLITVPTGALRRAKVIAGKNVDVEQLSLEKGHLIAKLVAKSAITEVIAKAAEGAIR